MVNAREAYKIVLENKPGWDAKICYDFGEFYSFNMAPLDSNGKIVSGFGNSMSYVVHKVDGKYEEVFGFDIPLTIIPDRIEVAELK